MLTPRSELQVAMIDGLVYAPGGYGGRDVLEAYDPAEDTWVQLANMPDGRDHATVTALDGVLYVIGGVEGITGVLAYDPQADAWENRARLPHARTAAAAVPLDGAVWLFGGNGPSTEEELREILRYDPAEDAWEVMGSLDENREHLGAALMGDAVHLLGGRFDGSFYTGTVIFADGSTSPGPTMLDERSGFQAAVVDELIFVAGGEVFTPAPELVPAMEFYDPADDTWHASEPLPAPVHGHGAASHDGVLYIIGGSDFPGGVMNMGRVWAFVD